MELNRVYCMDALEGLRQLPDNSVDLILTDPPYGVLGVDWDSEEINWEALADELYRVLRVNGSVYIFGQMPMLFDVYAAFSKKFKFKQDLVWSKNRAFSLANTVFTKYHENVLFFVKSIEERLQAFGTYLKEQRTSRGLTLSQIGVLCDEPWYHRGGHMYFETGLSCPTKEQYEKLKHVLNLDDRFDNLFEKPIFNFNDIKLEGQPYKITRKGQKLYGVTSDLGEYTSNNDGKRNPKTVLEYPIVQSGSEYVGHPTQKPVAMLRYLLSASSKEGDVVLDPFMGSGSTAVACQQSGRQFIGFELSQAYVKLIEKRLAQKSLVFLEVT